MKIEEAKANLNKRVHYTDGGRNIDADYIFTGCTIRKSGTEFFYQAELQDIKSNRSIIICKLENVQPLENGDKNDD